MPKRLDQLVRRAGGGALDVGLLDHGRVRLLGCVPRLQELGGSSCPGAALGIFSSTLPARGIPAPAGLRSLRTPLARLCGAFPCQPALVAAAVLAHIALQRGSHDTSLPRSPCLDGCLAGELHRGPRTKRLSRRSSIAKCRAPPSREVAPAFHPRRRTTGFPATTVWGDNAWRWEPGHYVTAAVRPMLRCSSRKSRRARRRHTSMSVATGAGTGLTGSGSAAGGSSS
jgi:hypothetical protein